MTPAETSEALENYDRMQQEGTITISQARQLKADAVDDQVSDTASECAD